jgi:hypothetical protein
MAKHTPVVVSGIWLRAEGKHAVVLVERDGQWTEVIREFLESPFSHIIEPDGVRSRCDAALATARQQEG